MAHKTLLDKIADELAKAQKAADTERGHQESKGGSGARNLKGDFLSAELAYQHTSLSALSLAQSTLTPTNLQAYVSPSPET